MKKLLWTACVVAVALFAAWWWLRDTGVRIAGEAAPLPRAEPEAEYVLPAALDSAAAAAREQGWRALVVHRHGHRVFEHFRRGEGSEVVDGGELGAVLASLAMLAPLSAQGEQAEAAGLISERLWVPLRAHDAWLRGGADASRITAQLDDWMRLGDLLLGQGTYHGERIAAVDAVRGVLANRAAQPWQGDEPLTARDGTWFDLEPGIRLWLAPRRGVAVLAWADGGQERDTRIPNIILRGLNDQAPAISGGLEDMVPGHGR